MRCASVTGASRSTNGPVVMRNLDLSSPETIFVDGGRSQTSNGMLHGCHACSCVPGTVW